MSNMSSFQRKLITERRKPCLLGVEKASWRRGETSSVIKDKSSPVDCVFWNQLE